MSPAEIVDGVQDEDFVTRHSTGRPFYSGISYLLVSMECLIGAAYTRKVEAAGLAGHARPSMGLRDADFADWRIGRCSHHAQMWVDRKFALDYTLKSLEKVLDGRPRHVVRATRVVLKDAAFALLLAMVALLEHYPLDRAYPAALDVVLAATLDRQLAALRERMATVVAEVEPVLSERDARVLITEHDRWVATESWQLINAADPCGT